MNTFNEQQFRQRLDAALRTIRTILDNARNPAHPADVPHRYEDKYLLAEFLGRTATAAALQCLGAMGLSSEGLAQLAVWAQTRSVTLRLRAQESCTFAREEKREVESAQRQVVEKRSMWGTSETTERVVTTVREYFWHFDFTWELVAFEGAAAEQAVVLQSHTGRVEIKTGAKSPPRPERVVRPHLDANVTLLLGLVDPQHRASFTIDRAAAACRTPRRNPAVESALWAFRELAAWCGRVHGYFTHELFSAHVDHGRDLATIRAEGVFVPVVPVFERTPGAGDAEGAIPSLYAGAFLAEQRRSLQEKSTALAQVFPRDASPTSFAEAALCVTALHTAEVCERFAEGVEAIEQMLRDQLGAAVGKTLTPADFTAYMDFHHRKLFRPEFRPRPFSHAIRRPDHAPEGAVSLELGSGDGSEAVHTVVATREAARPMGFALDAATRVSFRGERFVHAWVAHQFSGQRTTALNLIARARQFSAFVLLVGRIAAGDTFEPKAAVILQNKDVLKIPLLLEAIPTPKEFRDAIESLSPEQQRFARAFRAMQLESTLFGVCVVQIKPQLEALLGLPADALTKEIQLTEELLTLFIEHQIAGDLLSYDGPAEAPVAEKLAQVKGHVGRMQEMIDRSRKREIDEAREREALRLAEMNRTAAAVPPMPAMMGAMPVGAGMPYPVAPTAAMMSDGASVPPPRRGRAAPAMPGGPPPPAPAPAAATPAPAPAAATPAPAAVTPAPAPAATATPNANAPPNATATATPNAAAAGGAGDLFDLTRIPAELDRRFEALDDDSALRPTILTPGPTWTRTAQKGLLAAPATATLDAAAQRTEKNRAFDLLDALTKSGAIELTDATLHVVVAATHCFDKTLIDTVIEDNVNPVEKVERSVMIVATTLHRLPATALLADDQRERFLTHAPRLALPDATG